jgi:hypothetical protein
MKQTVQASTHLHTCHSLHTENKTEKKRTQQIYFLKPSNLILVFKKLTRYSVIQDVKKTGKSFGQWRLPARKALGGGGGGFGGNHTALFVAI